MWTLGSFSKVGSFLLLTALLPGAYSQVAGGFPTGDEIVAKYERFLGGRDALAKVTTRTVNTRRIVESGAPDESLLLRSSKRGNHSIMQHRNLDGTFDVWQNGCDGNSGWSHGVADAIRDWDASASAGPICHQELYYYGYLPLDSGDLKQSFKSLEVKIAFKFVQPSAAGYAGLAGGIGKDLIPPGVRDAYLVLATPARQGDNSAVLVFDKETGALLRRQFNRSAEQGDVAYTSFLQYRQVGDGTVAPFQFVTQNKIFTVHEVAMKIEDNAPMDESIFLKPKSALKENKGLN